MKIRVIRQKDLDSSCWLVQFWGKKVCNKCCYNRTKICGGNFGNAKRIRQGQIKVRSKKLSQKGGKNATGKM